MMQIDNIFIVEENFTPLELDFGKAGTFRAYGTQYFFYGFPA